jgi:hypothetical protein
VSREFYINDIYSWLAKRLEALAMKMNVWMRWV